MNKLNICNFISTVNYESSTTTFTEEKAMKKLFGFYKQYNIDSIKDDPSNDPIANFLIVNTELPYEIQNKNLEVIKSKIHGYGVFATENIKCGTILTFYPVHALCDHMTVGPDGDEGYYFANGKNFEPNDDYRLDISDRYSIFGNKKKTTDTSLLGHMINDSTTLKIDLPTKINVKNAVCRYILSSNNNCTLKMDKTTCVVYVVAMKDIAKGEELLMSYTPAYWLKKDAHIVLSELLEKDTLFKNFVADYYEEKDYMLQIN